MPPDGLKSERILRDPKIAGNRAHEHPTATGPTTVHTITVADSLEPRSSSPSGSEATQTSTSTTAVRHTPVEVDIGRGDFATHTSPHRETSCSQLDLEPNHAAHCSEACAIDEEGPQAATSLHLRSVSTRRSHGCEYVEVHSFVHGYMLRWASA